MLVMRRSLPEKGEVVSAHYKLVPADLRDVKQLNDIITITEMDPRYVLGFNPHTFSFVKFCYHQHNIDNCLDLSAHSTKGYENK